MRPLPLRVAPATLTIRPVAAQRYVEYGGMSDEEKEERWRQLREKTEALIAEALIRAGEGEELPALDLYGREWDHEEV